jgi:alpha-L-rhamnosidase
MVSSGSVVTIGDLRVEHLRETLGIGTSQPRLSWTIDTECQNWLQQAYEIECCSIDDTPRKTSGKIESDQSMLVPWPFAPLNSREQINLRVRVWGKDGSSTEWSETLSIEAGLLNPSDWSARFITPDWKEDTSISNPAPYLRREFEVRQGMKSARLYISALGVYEAEINGCVVGDQVMAPGWTSYHNHLRYQTFDVKSLLQEGTNTIGAIIGDGWFRGRLVYSGGRRNIWGEHLALLAQLEIQYEDGTKQTIISDEAWKAETGPLLMDSIYDGETYDARLEIPGWSAPGFDDSGWKKVRLLDWNMSTLIAPMGPPVRRIETLSPEAITRSPSGKTIVDFGQNLVGRVRISVEGAAGTTIILRHAEVLEGGELCTRPLRFAEATDRYNLRGNGRETWEPRFTFHGFRYAEVEGWPGELDPKEICAVAIHSDMERTGWFECSDPLLNRLHENVVWSMRGNFLDIPTDCPQRDERLGWTGDIEVFSPTAAFLYDCSGFLASWLADLACDQKELNGKVPHVVPNVLGNDGDAAAWADAAAIVPWVLYQRFGDKQLLADQFNSMKTWVDHEADLAGKSHLWDTGFQFGDWLDPTAPPENPALAKTNKDLIATAYLARSAEIVGRAADILEYAEEKQHYLALAEKVHKAFTSEYVTPAGRMMNDAETAYALALEFDLLPTAEQRKHAGKRLMELVRECGYHIRTGFVGTPLICDALCTTGEYLTAYRLLMQKECPSWLYPVTMGATTIWERWDSMLPDGSINPGGMTSFNHYALGAVADWMHRTIGGLVPVEPGYHRVKISPHPGGGITYAEVRHSTPYGMTECGWRIENDRFYVKALIPANTTAFVELPGSTEPPVEVGSGSWQWDIPYIYPDKNRRITIDDAIGEICYQPKAREALMEVFTRVGALEHVGQLLVNEQNMPLRRLLQTLPNSSLAIDLMSKALEDL